MNKIKETHTLLPFLIDPKYRIWRHLLFIITGGIITFNQVFVAYQDCSSELGNRIYLICFSSFILYLIVIYSNYFFLTPKLLLKDRYVIYSITLFILGFSMPAFFVLQEYIVRNAFDLPHRITSYTSPLILVDSLASFMITIICFLGVTAAQLFRNWIAENEHINELEYEHLKSELNKLKGQIAPTFLSKTLNNAAATVKTNPGKTTDMLMRLGQLLRYQLYDSNREKVPLKSEINFLTNFLSLGQLNKENKFRYDIETRGNLNNIFVSPLLFLSLIQDITEDSSCLNLLFENKGEYLLFQCKTDNKNELTDESLYLIEKRLGLQYPANYTLTLKAGIIELQINNGNNGHIGK